MFLIEDIFTASGLGLVDIKEDRAGSSLKTSSGMAAEKTDRHLPKTSKELPLLSALDQRLKEPTCVCRFVDPRLLMSFSF